MRTLAAILAIAAALPAAAAPTRHALLVGVARYDSPDLGALKYAEADVVALASALRDAGYQYDHITVMTHTVALVDAGLKPTGDAIRGRLRDLVEKCEKGDTLLIALTGHGVQFHGDPESYFCPADAILDEKDKSSLIALGSEVYRLLDFCKADMKLLLVDACRDRPASRSRSVAKLESRTRPVAQMPPGGTAAFFSCSAGERAFEHDGLKHGVFFHHVIEGLRGKADVDSDKAVTLPELELFVKKHTGSFVKKEFNQDQEPDLRNQTRGLAPLAKWDRPLLPWAGALGVPAGDAVMRKLGLDQPGATRVTFIHPGGPAEAAGLKVGDVVYAIGGRAVRSPKHFDDVANTYAPGESVTLGVGRDGKRLEVSLKFAAELTDAETLRQLLAAAQRPDVQAQIGGHYFSGYGVRQDLAEAARWYAKAAASGDPEGMYEFGACHQLGLGMPKDPAEAVRWYRRAADRGLAAARHNLALCYFYGNGVAKDEAEALRLVRLAAEQGYAAAQDDLGVLYAEGNGVPKNDAEAVRWYRRAAAQEHADAENRLGLMYYEGRGVKKDEAEGVRLFRLAADKNLAVARYNMGNANADGRGVPKDDAAAVRWYRKAALQGYADAQTQLGVMYETGRGVPKSDATALTWYRKAAAQDDPEGQYYVGLMYYEGRGVAKNFAEAAAWYRKAADQGLADAQNRLGVLAEKGEGVPKSTAEALKWYRKAAEQGDDWGQFNLGVMYHEGRGVAKNLAEAAAWVRKAADQGLADAQNKFGLLTERGEGVPRSVAEALKWYRKAADQGLAVAQYNVGIFYAEGRGVPANRAEALKWFRKAAAQGDEDAKAKVQELSKPPG